MIGCSETPSCHGGNVNDTASAFTSYLYVCNTSPSCSCSSPQGNITVILLSEPLAKSFRHHDILGDVSWSRPVHFSLRFTPHQSRLKTLTRTPRIDLVNQLGLSRRRSGERKHSVLCSYASGSTYSNYPEGLLFLFRNKALWPDNIDHQKLSDCRPQPLHQKVAA